jgi:hypothetical protein
MWRPSRRVAAFCIAIVAVAALLPGFSSFDHAWLQPTWILLRDEAPIVWTTPFVAVSEQPSSFHFPLDSRGPPNLLLS